MSIEAESNRPGTTSVSSNQTGVHSQLLAIVDKHCRHLYHKPVADHTRQVFSDVRNIVTEARRPLVLDSGCGVGESTAHLAAQFPDCWVIGVDKSAHRLSRFGDIDVARDGHCLWLRADLIDFWRLAVAADWQLYRHYLLYPNPWPKAEHLKRRWHAHPVFPYILRLGGVLDVRSNWSVYIDEMALALSQQTHEAVVSETLRPLTPITPFERKYAKREESLYRIVVDLGAGYSTGKIKIPV